MSSNSVSVDELIELLDESNVFLTGGAGVGKSYMTNGVIKSYRDSGKQVVPLGSTGISAVNIGGFTIHSFFVFGISSNLEELTANDKKNRSRLSELKKILKATDLIIIDEISMVSADLMEMLVSRLSTLSYSGKVMFVGDFYQLPPIVKRGVKSLFSDLLFAFESSAWERLNPTVVELTEMKRTEDREFTDILSKVRMGLCDDSVISYMLRLCNNDSVYATPCTYLFGRNAEVEKLNRENLNRLDGEETILFAQIEKFASVHEKRLETWKNLLPINEHLTLKIGVPILFTINKWGKYVNGDRGVLRAIEDDYLLVEKGDEFIRVQRHEFDLLDIVAHDNGKIEQISLATIKQFPVKLAYAVTIHKSQGMSIDNLVCNVDNIFATSQFYVAVSRATNPRNLKIDFSKNDITNYLRKVIRADARVKRYYSETRA